MGSLYSHTGAGGAEAVTGAIERYIGGLVIGQGRHAGQPFTVLPWQRRFLRGAFAQPDDAGLSLGRGGGKTTLIAALGAACVDVGGPLVAPNAESVIVASSFDQALIAFRHALHFMRPTFEAHKRRFRVSAATAVAAACFRARLARAPSPAGERTARVLAGYRRTAGDRGRGQTRPFGAADLAAVLATCHRPRRRGRGVESDQVALERGRLDAVIAGLLFMAGMRRSEVSALRWADVADAADGDGVLVTVRRSKTNQEGETTDVRFVKGGVARALRTLRAAASPAPEDRVVPLSPKMVGLRFQAAARAAGVERVTAHSGRVGLASELTSRGASTTDVMLAGNWKTSRMVAHYSAGATAERGAVARYL